MILYQLSCEEEHTFEAWFRDSAAYDEQAQCGHVECPYCGSTKVAKAPMAPHIVSGSNAKSHSHSSEDEAAECAAAASATAKEISNDFETNERAHEVAQKILHAVGEIRDYAEKNMEDVGDEFADEARKIHHGDAEERGIYGRATDDEAHDLEEEGVEFVRLPGTPRRNG